MKSMKAAVVCVAASTLFGAQANAQHYRQTDLVSDLPGAQIQDANLVNPWGLARSATSPWWVADNGTGVSTLYQGNGTPAPLVVTVPPPPGGSAPSAPTGVVFNGGSDFELAPGQPARFIFVTEEGTISGWNPTTNATNAVIMVNHSMAGDIFKGVTIGKNNNAPLLYAADFHGGRIEVFDTKFQEVNLGAGAFTDGTIPEGFAPFNVQSITGSIFVMFAKQDEDKEDEVAGEGLGYVDEFDTAGKLIRRLHHGRWFNAPWGIALAPDDFGKFSGDLLVGNFGSGKIAAFKIKNGTFHGLLRGEHGDPIEIEGLWAIAFGNGAAAGPANYAVLHCWNR